MAQRLNTLDGEGVYHFVTLNVRDRKKAFLRSEYAAMVVRELRYECDRHPAKLAAYVVMPDHLHFLFEPQDGKVTRFLARFKPGVTHELDALIVQHERDREHTWLLEKGRRELWQDGKYSLPIHSQQWLKEKIDYIHGNPMRAGLVEDPADYPFSSFRAYFCEKECESLVAVDMLEL